MDQYQHTYPIFLNLRDKPCLVVGGGRVAERRSRRLIECGARVTVISPKATRVIRRLQSLEKLTYIEREYRRGDLDGHSLVILATNDDGAHRQVIQDRDEAGQTILVNDAMKSERGDFATPALFREGPLSVAVATDGLMPTLASAMAEEVGRLFGHTAAKILRRYRAWKGSVVSRRDLGPEAARALRRAVDRRLLEALRSGDIRRVTTLLERAEKLSILRRGNEDLPHAPKPSLMTSNCGTVYLVGAGPGDPGLLTVKGRALIREADAVVYDRLIDAELLNLAPSWAAFHPVGKAPGRHALAQEDINRLLCELAGRHEVVVRLKGGDPFVFGRGGEEAESLQEAGVPYEVVPGVSSAVAVPAYAGIPLTHRTFASSFAVVTGHRASNGDGPRPIDVPEADTLVYLMGLANLPRIVEALLKEGKPAQLPAAVVSMGTTVRQQVATGTVETICEEVRRAGIRPPAVIVVGEVARCAESLGWFKLGGAEAFPADEETAAQRRERIPAEPETARATGAGA